MAYAQNGPYNTKLTLFPSLTLPNKLAYLMNPQETQEIQCQVAVSYTHLTLPTNREV